MSFALLLAACAAPAYSDDPVHSESVVETRVYDASRDAAADVDTALESVQGTDRLVIVSLGANWCHDSRGLVEHFAHPSIRPIIRERFEVIYVDVGTPQIGQARNDALAARFGISPLEGTPTVVFLDAEGVRLNAIAEARAWRNAHSRSVEDVRARLIEIAETSR